MIRKRQRVNPDLDRKIIYNMPRKIFLFAVLDTTILQTLIPHLVICFIIMTRICLYVPNNLDLRGVVKETSNDFWNETGINGLSNAGKASKVYLRRILIRYTEYYYFNL